MFPTEFLEFWKILWSFLGPLTTAILATTLILYFWYPEKFEKIVIHMTPTPHPRRPSLMLGLPERFVGFPLGRAHITFFSVPILGASSFQLAGARLPRG
jgi:hypothetical protein